MLRKYLFVCDGLSYPIIAHAANKASMRAYVRDTLGWSNDMPMPRHCCAAIV